MRNKIKQIQAVEMIATPQGDTVGIVNNIDFIKVERCCLKQSESKLSNKTGVYFLCKLNSLELYIGETVDMFKRLSTHDSNKDFWDYAICFSSDMLTKTTSVYLERNLIAKASKVGFELQNTSSGFSQPISFLDETKCEVVIDSISMIMDMLHEKEASMLGEEPIKVRQCEVEQKLSTKEQININDKEKEINKQGKYKAIRIEDEYEEFFDIQKRFAEKYNLLPTKVSACLKGNRNKHNGWKFEIIMK